MQVQLERPVTLPCGAVIEHRLAKAAITEGLADPRGWPTKRLERLYSGWADVGFPLMITGNVIVDADHIERPGNVIIDRVPGKAQREALEDWVAAGRKHGAHLWAQLSHSGRQTQKSVNGQPLSPSAIGVGLPGGLFGKPRAMTEAQIVQVIASFRRAAEVCKSVGFTGVQIHAAHGYLLSSFLSPLANRRDDQWGGSLDNRARLLMRIVEETRRVVGPEFPICVKLNSADFQKGGFVLEECAQVALMLEDAGVDLIEISGGSYENPAMIGERGGGKSADPPKRASTVAREAYFLECARALRRRVNLPIMLTGGLRSRAGMQQALDEGIDLIGLARPACVDPVSFARFLIGESESLPCWEENLRRDTGLLSNNSPLSLVRTIASFAGIYWFYEQLYRLGDGREANTRATPLLSMLRVMAAERQIEAKRRKLRKTGATTGNLTVADIQAARLRTVRD
ncbi:MAG: NADH:flavin oxidoreductase/NADH oxidase family protein [Hyphomicrobiaceae bacterium]|nr:NADH:flavin oxidoreductase/NADH oxidase family protein [Hyphomicrobiaceae bacterium]